MLLMSRRKLLAISKPTNKFLKYCFVNAMVFTSPNVFAAFSVPAQPHFAVESETIVFEEESYRRRRGITGVKKERLRHLSLRRLRLATISALRKVEPLRRRRCNQQISKTVAVNGHLCAAYCCPSVIPPL